MPSRKSINLSIVFVVIFSVSTLKSISNFAKYN
jgi:hypothetical protein